MFLLSSADFFQNQLFHKFLSVALVVVALVVSNCLDPYQDQCFAGHQQQTKVWICSCKNFFEKDRQQQKHEKLPSMQRVIFHCSCFR